MSSAPSKQGESLILASGRQIELLDMDEIGLPAAAYQRSEDRGRWTGDRLFFQHPRIYNAIAKLLARGQMAYREIAEDLEVSVNTVCGVAYREGIPIETLRERMGRLDLEVAMLSMECIRDLLSDPEWRAHVSAKDLAIIHGIAFQNSQLALGGATARIDSTKPAIPDHEAYNAYMRNVTPTATGLHAGNSGQKSAAPTVIDAEVTPVASPTPPPVDTRATE